MTQAEMRELRRIMLANTKTRVYKGKCVAIITQRIYDKWIKLELEFGT